MKQYTAKHWSILAGVLLTLTALISILYGAVNLTSTPSFCSTCHEMTPEYVTFEASSHNQISCVKCHSKPGIKNSVAGKVQLLKEVYHHLVGSPSTIIQTVAVSNETCEKCHSSNRLVTATGDVIVNHQGHIKRDIPCITCHRGVVHAKIVERGLNDSSTSVSWTAENAKKLMNEKFIKPNMGTCVACHEQVNQGKEPWKNVSYNIPQRWQKGKLETIGEASGFKETPEMKAGTALTRDRPKNMQNSTLEVIGKQQANVKIPMQCPTCHQQINKPQNHEIKNWTQNHGQFAVKDLAECLRCHQDSLWLKEAEKQDISELLTGIVKKEPSQQDLTAVKEESRRNQFCSTCHAYIPTSHLDRSAWLFNTHRLNSGTPEERKACFVCHENGKPSDNSNSPSVVYCELCHNKGDFPEEP